MKSTAIFVLCICLLMLASCGLSRQPEKRAHAAGDPGIGTSKSVPPQPASATTPAPVPELKPAVTPTPTPPVRQSLKPVHLSIPAIGLEADVEMVGVLPEGAMDVPKAFDRVGLLYPGVLPGEKGNAVMDGHVDHYTGPAVFYYLKRLVPGDKIIVKDLAGGSLTFGVRSVEAFKTAEAPLGRIFGAAGAPHLNLITCTGKFNRKTQEHAMRLVVFAELQEDG